MKVIKHNSALKGKNSDKCKTLEYSFMDKDIDLGIATISGRYPDEGLWNWRKSKWKIIL